MIAAGDGVLSNPILLVILLIGVLAVRFNRRLARAHSALFGASGRTLRRWEMVLLRLLWIVAGWAAFVLALLILVEHS